MWGFKIIIKAVQTCKFEALTLWYCELNMFCKNTLAGYKVLFSNLVINFGMSVKLSSDIVCVHFGSRKFIGEVNATFIYHERMHAPRITAITNNKLKQL